MNPRRYDPAPDEQYDDSTPACAYCGCTEENCSGCIERTGAHCHWVADPKGRPIDLCSACLDRVDEPLPRRPSPRSRRRPGKAQIGLQRQPIPPGVFMLASIDGESRVVLWNPEWPRPLWAGGDLPEGAAISIKYTAPGLRIPAANIGKRLTKLGFTVTVRSINPRGLAFIGSQPARMESKR